MAFFDKLLIDRILDSARLESASKEAIRLFASSDQVDERVSETAKTVRDRNNIWSSRDADRVLRYSGRELWATLRPVASGVWVEMGDISPARLTREMGEGNFGRPREKLVDLRGKERYG